MITGRNGTGLSARERYEERLREKQQQSNSNLVAETTKRQWATGYHRYPNSIKPKKTINKYASDRRWLADGLSALDCFRHHLTGKPYVSNDVRQGIVIDYRDKAADYSYIQHNHPKKIIWLVFDVDRGNQSFYAYEEAGLPPPNIIVQNPENGNCHLFYRLAQPVWTHNNNNGTHTKGERYLKRIYSSLVEQMAADSSYHPSSVMCKNPLSSQWRVFDNHNRPVTLDYLADFARFSSKKRSYIPAKETVELDESKRNCSLFESLRQYSYERLSQYKVNTPQPVIIKDVVVKKFRTQP